MPFRNEYGYLATEWWNWDRFPSTLRRIGTKINIKHIFCVCLVSWQLEFGYHMTRPNQGLTLGRRKAEPWKVLIQGSGLFWEHNKRKSSGQFLRYWRSYILCALRGTPHWMYDWLWLWTNSSCMFAKQSWTLNDIGCKRFQLQFTEQNASHLTGNRECKE